MKRKLTGKISTLTVMIFISSLVVAASAANAATPIRLFLNGREIPCDVPPAVVSERVLVPIGIVSEGMGYYAYWDQEHQTVLINKDNGGLTRAENPGQSIALFVNGAFIPTDVAPIVEGERILVPLRAAAEALQLTPKWDDLNRFVVLTGDAPETPPITPPVDNDNSSDPVDTTDISGLADPYHVTIKGEPIATAGQLKAILKVKNPAAPDVVDLYLSIGKIYGIRGDVAFCQAALETGWWKYGGIVQPWQNNYCGLGATGTAIEDASKVSLNGADPKNVWYVTGVHGACFSTPAVGVEAQIQHLYAYINADNDNRTVPAGRTLYDPRFMAPPADYKSLYWQDLSGKWAVPGIGYGQDIIDNFLKPALQY